MFGWFRRKPGFAEFAAPARARSIRRYLKAANPKMRAPAGFEHVVTERAKPMFGIEIAESQSLKSARKSLHGVHAGGRK